jgi:hypothetical protein
MPASAATSQLIEIRPVGSRQCTVLRSVGGKFMKHHPEADCLPGGQIDRWTVLCHSTVPLACIGSEFHGQQSIKRCALPCSLREQIVRDRKCPQAREERLVE